MHCLRNGHDDGMAKNACGGCLRHRRGQLCVRGGREDRRNDRPRSARDDGGEGARRRARPDVVPADPAADSRRPEPVKKVRAKSRATRRAIARRGARCPMATKNSGSNGGDELTTRENGGSGVPKPAASSPAAGGPAGGGQRRRKAGAPSARIRTAAAAGAGDVEIGELFPAPSYEQWNALLAALRTLKEGDFSVRLTARDTDGPMREMA